MGLLSDLTGVFSSLVQVIVTGHEVYWDNVNANGGINGLMVEVVPVDTGYVVDQHVQRYEELKDEVVAFGHSTGSPHTVAITDQLEADGILAIP
ncbi:MAG: ABC transporter substrate-binding protein, partial [Actinobacteria bacterium]|nr:ABC transporter substrate-binding protein [Actinomycetota bacterium]